MKRDRQNGYLSTVGAGLKLFSDGDLEQIHLTTLEILGQVGIYVEGEEAQNMYRRAGCRVEGDIVKIPEYIVEEAIRTSPGSPHICGREEKYDVPMQKGRTYFCPVGQPCYVNDLETGEYRLSTLEDVRNTARLVDALDEYDMSDAMVAACDVPPEVMDFYIFAAQAANTSKFVMTFPAVDQDKQELFIEMAAAVAGSLEELQRRPFVIFGSSIISPLVLKKEAAASLVLAAEHNLPALGGSMVMSGGTGPATIAGSLALQNAELLAALVLTQTTRPGAPFICGSSLGMMYLKTAVPCVGSPESALLNAGAAKLAQLYNLPSCVGGT